MRLAQIVPTLAALIIGCLLAVFAAVFAVNIVENRSKDDVIRVLGLNGHDWTEVDVDGLQVVLGGFAPDEATRFQALSIAGTVVDASRVVDMMNVTVRDPVKPPRFSVEILRNDDGISLIGLVPAEMDRESIVITIQDIAGGANVTDLLKTADYPSPEGWENALTYGLYALSDLPRSKISISSGRVEIRAISDSISAKRKLETDLALKIPELLDVKIDISAPRPVITPFTLRFLIGEEGAQFDACSTDSEGGRNLILAAAREAGMVGKATCTIGLGNPSPNWDAAVVTGIKSLAAIGGGSITFSDADVTLVALDTVSQRDFDLHIGELEANLPDVFSLHAILPEPVKIDGTGEGAGPPEFVATKSPEGLVQLRGRISDERTRVATESYARAQFGSAVVHGAMRLDPDLPLGWSTRVLASLQSLSLLHNGSAIMQPDFVEIRGVTGSANARAEIARILSQKLGESENYKISVIYEEKLDPLADIPTAEECVEQINLVLSVQQITFEPSSADIDDVAQGSINSIVEIMRKCTDVRMEVGGHTDSQGREVMNLSLSQSRAEAVISALLTRRVLTSNLTAIGFGETVPVADNGTQAGREANRRIEFKLIVPEIEEPPEELENAADDSGADPTEPVATVTEEPDEQN